jgi:hypothetical protein
MSKYAEMLFRHKIRFTALLLLPIALGTAVLVVFSSHRATATLRIEDPSSFGATFIPVGWSANLTPAQNLAESIRQVVKTPAFSQALSDRLSKSSAVSSAAELRQTLASTGTNLTITPTATNLVMLSYSCPRSAVCVQVIGDTIDIFREQLVKTQQDRAGASVAFWNGQLKDAQANLAVARTALHSYVSNHPGAAITADSSDPQVAVLVDSVSQWQANVLETEDSLSRAQYVGSASASLIQAGTSVVDPPHLATPSVDGDGSSVVPAAFILLVGLTGVGAYIVVLAWLDRTVGDAKGLERRLLVPVVATIPKLVSTQGL